MRCNRALGLLSTAGCPAIAKTVTGARKTPAAIHTPLISGPPMPDARPTLAERRYRPHLDGQDVLERHCEDSVLHPAPINRIHSRFGVVQRWLEVGGYERHEAQRSDREGDETENVVQVHLRPRSLVLGCIMQP